MKKKNIAFLIILFLISTIIGCYFVLSAYNNMSSEAFNSTPRSSAFFIGIPFLIIDCIVIWILCKKKKPNK